MPLVDIVRSAQGTRMEDQDGWVETLEFSPGLSAEEIEELSTACLVHCRRTWRVVGVQPRL